MSIERMPSVLVVIPTLNEVRHIEGVVERLVAGLPDSAPVSVVVADGGSTDGTVNKVLALVSKYPAGLLSLLRNPRRLQSAAVNLAATSLGQHADVLIRCDAHADYPPNFIASLVASLQRSGADAVVVPMDSQGEDCLQKAVAWVSDTPMGSGGSAHRGGRKSGFVDHGHHAAFRMASFRRAGGYDESFSHNEDAELDCRQRAMGSRIYLDADIRLGYHPRNTFKGLWKQYFGYGKGRARTIRRHPDSIRARQMAVPAHYAVCLLALLAAPWWPAGLAWPALYLAAAAITSLTGVLKLRSLCGLLAGPAAVLMHAAWAAGFVWSLLVIRERQWTAPPSAQGAGG